MHALAAEERTILAQLGRRIRETRAARGLSRKVLATASGVSERYLAQLESGRANASVLVLDQVARALRVPVTGFLCDEAPKSTAPAPSQRNDRIALIGLRGAGKSTLGKRLASRRHVPFIELDREIERQAGLSMSAIFELYGDSGFRRFERFCLDAILRSHRRFVLATGGSIVSDEATFARLLESCFTVWLRTTPAQHMERVIAQGDLRPMSGNPKAMDDLKRILQSRRHLYERADRVVETSRGTVAETLDLLSAALPARPSPRRA